MVAVGVPALEVCCLRVTVKLKLYCCNMAQGGI